MLVFDFVSSRQRTYSLEYYISKKVYSVKQGVLELTI
jgi:hypothetical protein